VASKGYLILRRPRSGHLEGRTIVDPRFLWPVAGLSKTRCLLSSLRALMLRWGLGVMLGLSLVVLGGCSWAPLYANLETGPADAEIRAIRVAPISERIGQKLALALRESLNPTGELTPQRYLLRTTLSTSRQDLGIQTLGLGTRGKLDAFANFSLSDSTTGALLLHGTSHVAESFDILANMYSNVVAEDDARTRAVEEMRRDIVTRLTLFLQRRMAERTVKP
jgi:LPS-assembly lipoprotein